MRHGDYTGKLEMKFRRRKYLVNAGLQMKITLLFVAVSMLGGIGAAAAFNFFALRKLEAFMWSTHISVKDTGEIIRPLFIYVNIIDVFFVSILLIITVLWMMRKTSGPIYRMSRDIMRIANGDLSANIILGERDEFKDAAHELNVMVNSMKERFRNINIRHSNISKFITELKKDINSPDMTTKNYESLLNEIGNLETEISSFKLHG
jgi:methyl-accepting chemotaxis protein